MISSPTTPKPGSVADALDYIARDKIVSEDDKRWPSSTIAALAKKAGAWSRDRVPSFGKSWRGDIIMGVTYPKDGRFKYDGVRWFCFSGNDI